MPSATGKRARHTAKDAPPKKALTGEVLAPDLIADIVHEIETLTRADAGALIDRLIDGGAFIDFKLAGALALFRTNKWYGPHATFAKFCVSRDIHPRKAQRLMRIYKNLVDAKVPWENLCHLGWAKVGVISPLLTQENAPHWIKIAETQSMLQLQETIKDAEKNLAHGHKGLEDQPSERATRRTFKVHEDQNRVIDEALKRAKEQSGSSDNTAALACICLEFLGGAKHPSLKEQLQAVGLDDAANAFAEAYPNVDIQLQLSPVATPRDRRAPSKK